MTGLGALQGAPFSHAQHLKLKLTCVQCHASATASTQRADNNLPTGAICASCHTGAAGQPAVIASATIKEPRATFLDKFNHQQHMNLGNIAPMLLRAIEAKKYLKPLTSEAQAEMQGHLQTAQANKNVCGACHRGLEQAATVTRAHHPEMADCLVCHSDIDPPFSCTKCHVDSPALRPASHTADWVDVHSSGKANLDKPSCAVCHGTRFTCRGCH